ncbi:RHS repeat domain-containing protein [Nonomuraea endophytica]|uniref:RHS repeat-associated protein n=1 Tax=Nonomuraea endophytica TaxID=714136 RepID=A0A7W8A049_9ACTN|nr:RHS repeat-associated core domain-containing protein [Nonomuraea endophytica]MBB5077068.1 RHS repeat-associated protein [Nonomuraea endophytica]
MAPVLAASEAASAIADGEVVAPVQQNGAGAPKDFLVSSDATAASASGGQSARQLRRPADALRLDGRANGVRPISRTMKTGPAPRSGAERTEAVDRAAAQRPFIDDMFPDDQSLAGSVTPVLSVVATRLGGGTSAQFRFFFTVCEKVEAGSPSVPCVESGGLDGIDAWQVPAGKLAWAKEYEWRVRVTDPERGTETTTETRTFTTGVRQPFIGATLGERGADGQDFHQLSGNYRTQITDAAVPVAGPPLSVVRTYNSLDSRSPGIFGAGWSSRWDMKITPEVNTAGTATLLVTLANGRQARFAAKGAGAFQPPPGLDATLTEVAGGGWRLMDKSSTNYLFDAQGRLTRVADARDRAQELLYGTGGKLAKVTSTGGRSLTFAWNGNHVSEVSTDPVDGTSLKWTYEYVGDNLSKACTPVAANCTQYGYETGSRYRSLILDADPVAYFRLGDKQYEPPANEGNTGGNGVYVDVAVGQQGALAGSGDTAGGFTKSALTLPSGTVAELKDRLSIENWFKTTSNGVIFSAADIGYLYGAMFPALYVGTDGKLRGQYGNVRNGAGQWVYTPITSAGRVNDGQWHHTVLNVVGDKQQLFLDGQLVGELTGELENSWRTHAALGGGDRGSNWADVPAGSTVAGAWTFKGSLDELAIYGRALTTDEVSRHYAARLAAPNKLAKVTLPSGRVWAQNTYDSVSERVATHVDQHNGTWKVGKSEYDWMTGESSITVTDPQNATLKYVHDRWRVNQLLSQTDQLGYTTSYAYDTGGYLAKMTDANANVVEQDHDKRGNVISTKTCRANGSCQRSWAEYHVNKDDPFDPKNDRVLKVRDGRSSGETDNTYVTSLEYNQFGEQTKQTSPATPDFPNGRSSTVAYTDGTEPAVGGGTTPAGLTKTKTDARGNSWTYRYTKAGDLAEQTDPEGLVMKLEYDTVGRLASSTQVSSAYPGGVKTTFTYDALGRLETQTDPGVKNEVSDVTHSRKTTLAYDPDGNKLSETFADLTGGDAARSTVYTYDGQGRMETSTGPEGGVVRQMWNTLGQLARVTDARGTVIENGYSPRGELITRTVKGWTGSPVNPQPARDVVLESFAYDPAGRAATRTDAMGRKTSFTYFGDNLLSQKISDDAKLNGSATPRDVVLEDHTYDAAGNRVKLVTGGGTVTTEVVYDAAGRITSQTFDPGTLKRKTAFTYDANGNVLKAMSTGAGTTRTEIKEFAYNKANQPTRETVENGDADLVASLAYDDRGLVTAMTDPRGNVSGASAADFTTTMRYDAMGRLVEAVGPQVAVDKAGSSAGAKPTARIGYDTFGGTTHKTDPEGRTITSVFDKAGRLTGEIAPSYTPPGGTAVTPTTAHAYDLAGQLVRTTDPRGNSSTFEYDQLGRQVRANDPAPQGQPAGQSVVDYDLVGEKLAATGPTGARTEATYDDLGRMITSTQVERKPAAAAYTTKLEYNDAGVLTKQIAPGNRTTGFAVNAAGEVTTQTDPATNKTLMAYDLAGRLVKTTDPEGNATVAEYDLAGRQTGTQDLNATGALVRSASTAYDAAGNPTSATSPEGHITKQTYDALNRVTSLIEPVSAGESITTSFGYDASGARTRLTDGRGNATWTSYNTLGLTESVTEPSTTAHPSLADRTWTSVYDQAGNPAASLLPGGVRIDRTFDHLNRLTAETGAGGGAASAERTFSYDLAGRATAIGDLTVDYNDRGLPLSVKKGTVQQTGYAYNELGAPSQRVDAAGTATFTWDNVGRLATAVDPVTGRTLTYGYDKSSRLKTLTGKTSTGAAADSQTFTYDAVDRLESQTLKNGAGTQLAKITYGWDKDDNLTTKTTTGTAGEGSNTYSYDHAGRLTSWTAPDGAKTDYGWDASGNRTRAGDKTFTYDERNRLITGDGTEYTYTARGTLAAETKNGHTTNLTFDAFDRLIADGDSLYSYDALNRVTSRTRGTAKQTFAYSGLSNDLAAISDISGGIQAKYGRDPFGELLGLQEGTSPAAGAFTDLHRDLVATFTTTTLATSTAYDPFGAVTAQTGTKTNLDYQSEYTDPDTGKTNMHARWYEPGTGTFTSRDTATLNPNPSVQANRYAYANASPLTGIDPTGHARESTGLEYGGGGYSGDICSIPSQIQRCGEESGAGGLPVGNSYGGGGAVACSGAGLDICGAFYYGVTVMTIEQMKRENVLPNGWTPKKGFWKADKRVIDQFIEEAYNGVDPADLDLAWEGYLEMVAAGDLPVAGGASGGSRKKSSKKTSKAKGGGSDRLSEAERAWCKANIVRCSHAYGFAKLVSEYLDDKLGEGKGGARRNAIRHFIWQVLLTWEYGVSGAAEIGDTHEKGGQPCRAGVPCDTRIDQFNNAAARKWATYNRTAWYPRYREARNSTYPMAEAFKPVLDALFNVGASLYQTGTLTKKDPTCAKVGCKS